MSEETNPRLYNSRINSVGTANEESEGSSSQNCHLNESEPSYGIRQLLMSKSNILHVNDACSEGRWAKKDSSFTRGRPVGYVPESCNHDRHLLSTVTILVLWSQGVADLVVVVVKPRAYEDDGDASEDKTFGKRRKVKGKGPDMETKSN